MPRELSAKAHEQALDAASQLFAERGIDRTSVDAIAEAAGVSKATIYKHWSDKEALLLEVMARVSGLNERPDFNSGDTRRDLTGVLSYRPPESCAERGQKISPHLIAYSAHNPEFGRTWRTTVMDPPRREIREILKRGISNGEFPKNLDLDLAMTLLLGPMLYRKIFEAQFDSEPKKIAAQVVDAFCRAFEKKSKP